MTFRSRPEWLGPLLNMLLLVSPAVAKQVTLRLPLQPGEPEEIAVVIFDDEHVSAADVKRWILLDEHGEYSTPIALVYADCRTSDAPKLEQEIVRARQTVAELDPNNYPPELSAVVMYLNNLQSLWLWMGEQELEFLKTGKGPDNEYEGTELERCQVHPETLDREQACHEVSYTWHNCALRIMEAKLGSYPKEQWKAFLDTYGIQERIESTIDD